MTEKDREAFEAAWKQTYPADNLRRLSNGDYENYYVANGWRGWQACAAHYTPKLTETEAANICEEVAIRENNPCLYETMMAALRAAGVRFKEEA